MQHVTKMSFWQLSMFLRSPDRDVAVAGGELPHYPWDSVPGPLREAWTSCRQLSAAGAVCARVEACAIPASISYASGMHGALMGPCTLQCSSFPFSVPFSSMWSQDSATLKQVLVEYKPGRCRYLLFNPILSFQSVHCNVIFILIGRPRQHIAFEHAVVM